MPYSVLIIGCGAIAGGYDADRSKEGPAADWPLSHAGAISRDDRFDLAACVDPDDSVREAFAVRWDVPVHEPSLEALAAEPGDFDLVVIASPTQFHLEHLEWARFLSPEIVFCEKPIAAGFDRVLETVDRFRDSDIALGVNHTRRWAPDLVALADQVHEGEWGDAICAVGTYGKGVAHNGSHMVDLLMMFLGQVNVYSVGPAIRDHWDDDPSVNAILRAGEWNTPVHLVAGDCRDVTQFELVMTFEKGEIAMRDGGMRIETRRAAESTQFSGYRTLGEPESVAGRYPEAMACAYDNIADALENDAPLASTGYSAFHAHAVCEEIRRKALKNLEKDDE